MLSRKKHRWLVLSWQKTFKMCYHGKKTDSIYFHGKKDS